MTRKWYLVLILTLVTSLSFSQNIKGKIFGRITNRKGEPLQATLSILIPSTKFSQTFQTGSNGEYHFEFPAGFEAIYLRLEIHPHSSLRNIYKDRTEVLELNFGAANVDVSEKEKKWDFSLEYTDEYLSKDWQFFINYFTPLFDEPNQKGKQKALGHRGDVLDVIKKKSSLFGDSWVYGRLISHNHTHPEPADSLFGWVKSNQISTEKTVFNQTYLDSMTYLEKRKRLALLREQYLVKNPSLNVKFKEAIQQGNVINGMTEEMVRLSWGEPKSVLNQATLYGKRIQWIFQLERTNKELTVNFENGVVVSVQR
jgi:hypothetical protein